MLRAERDLARARRVARSGEPAPGGTSFTAAIRGVREHSTPYHLAHGLLDHAEYLLSQPDTDGTADAAAALREARDIGSRLRCRPLLDRTDAVGLRSPWPAGAVPGRPDQA